ncbi:Uncharacterised protein [Mycobacteroides abscessus subsp. massiliense]|nr:Uncharacterised protein [Mycobacteroides abscessus subsp. massiliense]
MVNSRSPWPATAIKPLSMSAARAALIARESRPMAAAISARLAERSSDNACAIADRKRRCTGVALFQRARNSASISSATCRAACSTSAIRI